MNIEAATLALYTIGAAALASTLGRLKTRLKLSKAKHPSLSGHSRMARRVARLIPFYEYDEAGFFASDDAPNAVARQRRDAFRRLAALYRQRFALTAAQTAEVEDAVSDLRFISSYRVPFQFSRHVRAHLKAGSFVHSSSGVTITDLAGNRFYDLSGAYGVNLFGYDFYKDCIDQGSDLVRALGPVLAGRQRACRRLRPCGLHRVAQATARDLQRARHPFAPQQVKWCALIQPDIMKRIGQDLGDPDQTGTQVLEKEQMHGAKQQPGHAERQPQQTRIG